ncbi:MAG: family oxidoreductase [Acidimicrobiales bacterium]|nr:family oxidoreductase [Acidimicrobiales bacterium]
MEELSGKVAVVTGAASGIGLAMVHAFAAEGMRVVLADIEAEALDKAVADLPAGVEALSMVTDVSKSEEVDRLRDAALERFGAVHVVCNNAGVSSGGKSWEQSVEDWAWVLGVNLWGVIHGVRAFTPLLIEQGEGHIVNTASMAGLTSPPYMGAYNVSKHGVVTLSETLFGELQVEGSAVGVSVLCPGWVNTRIHEADRNRPGGADAGGGAMEAGMRDVVAGLLATGLQPTDVADLVVDAVKQRRFYILSHPEWKPMISGRVERIVAEQDPAIGMLPN